MYNDDLVEKYKTIIKTTINEHENSLDHLNLKQLQCITSLILDGAKTNYRHCAPEFEGKEYQSMGYIGAGWFVEDKRNYS